MGSDYGDVLRALCLLKANSDATSRQAIAGVLGINLVSREVPTEQLGSNVDEIQTSGTQTPIDVEQSHPVAAQANTVPFTIRFLEEAPVESAPAWLQSATVLPKPTNVVPRGIVKQSLLAPIWTRGLFVSVLATVCDSAEIDLEGLVRMISSGSQLETLPFVRVPTLSRGVHCWIDAGPAMEPFLQDQGQVIAHLRRIAGASRVNVRKFRGLPRRAGNFTAGAPHLVLSDLGAIPLPDTYAPESAAVEDWVDFVAWVRDEWQARVTVLTPVSPKNYEPSIRKVATLLHWDRKTNVQTSRRALAE